MGNKIEIDELTAQPEYESRCDIFVKEVESEVAPKYPKLFIISENNTKSLVGPSKNDDMFKQVLIEREGIDAWNSLMNYVTQWNRLKDIESLTQNTAYISVHGLEEDSVPLIEQAIEEIFSTARKYRGEFEPTDWNGVDCEKVGHIFLYEDKPPSAFLFFVFKNQ